jgi:hypothetical protein
VKLSIHIVIIDYNGRHLKFAFGGFNIYHSPILLPLCGEENEKDGRRE